MSQKLVDALAELDEDLVLEEVRSSVSRNAAALEILSDLQEGMNIVGKRFEEKEYFLSELIMSAEIFKEANKLLGGDDNKEISARYGTFVIGTIYDDVHDIGKNLVAAVMSSNSFRVIDLGVDVPPENFIEAIRQYKPNAVGISCLLTSCFDNVKNCIQMIESAGLRKDVKIVIGGASVNEAVGAYVKADAVCYNPQDTVEVCRKYIGGELVETN